MWQKKRRFLLWLRLRQISQSLSFFLFLFLFVKTDYTGSDELEYAVNIFFRIDPLIAASAILAGKKFITLFFPALATIILTLFLGRFFCGWFCPLGTLIDYTNSFWRKRRKPSTPFLSLKYILLVIILTAALSGIPLAGYLDPLCLLFRGLAFALYPAFNNLVTSFFNFTYQYCPEWFNLLTEAVYSLMKSTILPFNQKEFNLSLLSLGLLAGIFFLERSGRRYFCCNICPLGAFLSLLANFSLFQIRKKDGEKDCDKCSKCIKNCRMGAMNESQESAESTCCLCLDCSIICPKGCISFRPYIPDHKSGFNFISRRVFLTSATAGLLSPLFINRSFGFQKSNPLIIRPPGSLSEKDFSGTCIRCGECIKVCITNGLQPLFFEAGPANIFTPKLIPRKGYCEYNCSLCGQVCPSGAIENLSPEEKRIVIIGNAHFDKNRCLPYAKGESCLVCEEHCPVPDKAIKFRKISHKNIRGDEIILKKPYIEDRLCIGCGICENKCPLPGHAAIIVTNAGESRKT